MKIAAAQLTCVPADIPANVRRLAALAGQAREQGAELLVLPELALTGYELGALSEDPGLLVDANDQRLDALRSSGIAIVVNAAVANGVPGARPAIGTFVYGPDGELITRYLKQHLYEQERSLFAPGDRDGRFELGGVRFALAICYDSHFADLSARAAADGCQVYLASALYGTGDGVEQRATVYPRMAEDTGLFVALANHVGPSGPWTGCGRAAIWAPGGELLAEADDRTPMLVTAEVGRSGVSTR
ncbi:carbon-nitrogen hydrolase family protein [Streptomyces sp. C11-1]|uniref:Carbon-nitrogen hydrolase family protein n=1 Tax=Streptomyces durocortorensis TaxID=2811104 RepID=A0ABY9VYT5_9ACTN|nr:carbon-nitrogen hydrolase family protein [Streptomyces durocortorensis]WNF28873.1 carbon-nitrogen hydrolase family protein [Streptomyces durocortorensis]